MVVMITLVIMMMVEVMMVLFIMMRVGYDYTVDFNDS